jgi:hypothetical protein
MKTVYYKGQPYAFKVMGNVKQQRQYSLYNREGLLMHFVAERDLDKRPTLIENIIGMYYRAIMEEQPPLLG